MGDLRTELKFLGLLSIRALVIVFVLQLALLASPTIFEFFSNVQGVAYKYRDLFAFTLTAALITIVIFAGIAALEKRPEEKE